MKKITILILAASLLSACASPEVWHRAATSQQVAEADILTCHSRAAREGYGNGLYGGIAGYDYVHRCMASLGYHASIY
jgi:hypothetical protein